jgi:subtilase family serine protease
MATDNLASQLSCSWGFDIDATAQQIFQQLAAQGQSFFLAAGDQPADDPYLTVVGGTTLTTDIAHHWSSETTWSGSGGGISSIYPIPDWQQGLDMSANHGSTSMRNLPDVAMIADDVWEWADDGQSFAVVGTSIAAPLWAAFTALVNQQGTAQGKPPVGFLNPALYAIGKSAGYRQSFHDITTGNNTDSASPNLFFATAGYDLCTGWGTPNGGANLINELLAPPMEPLSIDPPLGFTAQGPVGGPFTVTEESYTLTNLGSTSLSWSLMSASDWLDVSTNAGSLSLGGPASAVTVTLDPVASSFLIGSYVAYVFFTNDNDGVTQERTFLLQVGNAGFETGDFTDWYFSGDPRNSFADSIDSTDLVGSTLPG